MVNDDVAGPRYPRPGHASARSSTSWCQLSSCFPASALLRSSGTSMGRTFTHNKNAAPAMSRQIPAHTSARASAPLTRPVIVRMAP